MISLGMRSSAILNNIFTFLNIGVILFVVICGSLKGESSGSIPSMIHSFISHITVTKKMQIVLGWKLSPVVFYHWIRLRNATWLSFQRIIKSPNHRYERSQYFLNFCSFMELSSGSEELEHCKRKYNSTWWVGRRWIHTLRFYRYHKRCCQVLLRFRGLR